MKPLVLVLAVLLCVGVACNLELLNEQNQGEADTIITAPDVVPTPPLANIEDIREVVIAKSPIGSCDTDPSEISEACPDPALLTCRAKDRNGDDLSHGFQPSWFAQAPVGVTASNVNVWNARAGCDTAGLTGSVICIVTVIGGNPEDQASAEVFFLCVP